MKPKVLIATDTLIDACKRAEYTTDNPGFCMACGEEADGCEPDAQAYECDSCGESAVYGAMEVLLRGWHK